MNDEEPEEENTSIIGAIIAITLLVVLIIAVMGYPLMVRENELSYLKKQLKNKDNVSEDYYNGWRDCIQELKKYRNKASNVTSTQEVFI